MKAKRLNTAHVWENHFCKDCSWPVIHACCNDEFRHFKDADTWDWWVYCSNKGCKNHDGEGQFQHEIVWMFVEEPS